MKSVCLDLRQPLSLPDQRLSPSRAWFMHGGPSVPRMVHAWWSVGLMAHCCRGSPYLSNRSVRPIARGSPLGAVLQSISFIFCSCVHRRAQRSKYFFKLSLVRKAGHTDGRTEDAVFVCSTGGKAQFRLRLASPSKVEPKLGFGAQD